MAVSHSVQTISLGRANREARENGLFRKSVTQNLAGGYHCTYLLGHVRAIIPSRRDSGSYDHSETLCMVPAAAEAQRSFRTFYDVFCLTSRPRKASIRS
jgi:hypothetical protein